MHLMRSKKLTNTWVAEQVWSLPSLGPIPSQNSQFLNEMGTKLCNGTSPCFFAFVRGGVWQVIPKYFYFSEKTFCFLYMQYPSKKWCTFVETTFVTVLLSQLQMQLWMIYKQGCTAFWKLTCVWTQHTLEEAFRFFGRNLRFSEEAFHFVVQLCHKHTFRMCSECWCHSFFDMYRI